jgi:hypothetical protein
MVSGFKRPIFNEAELLNESWTAGGKVLFPGPSAQCKIQSWVPLC